EVFGVEFSGTEESEATRAELSFDDGAHEHTFRSDVCYWIPGPSSRIPDRSGGGVDVALPYIWVPGHSPVGVDEDPFRRRPDDSPVAAHEDPAGMPPSPGRQARRSGVRTLDQRRDGLRPRCAVPSAAPRSRGAAEGEEGRHRGDHHDPGDAAGDPA